MANCRTANNQHRITEIQAELHQLEKRKNALLLELDQLSKPDAEEATRFLGYQAFPKEPETSKEKIELFLRLFRCRSDVFPRYWENARSKKTGFSPACANEWKRGICLKPKVKCGSCTNQAFVPFDSEIAQSHLTGRMSIGSYAIYEDDTCVFLAADFDKSSWQDDVAAYRQAAAKMQVQVAVEISKSGNGAHAWIFFHDHVPANKARRLGEIILSRAMDRQNTLGLDSYDRFFPNQDLLPSGGFGNLIALPLQKRYRDAGFCVFVDEDFDSIPNQWRYLASLCCLSESDIDALLDQTSIHEYPLNDYDEVAVAESIVGLQNDQKKKRPYRSQITIYLKGQIAVPLNELPTKVINTLKKLATFSNPKYFEAQRMRFSTWNIPKYVFCGDNDPNCLYLPRGLLEETQSTLAQLGYKVAIEDRRNNNDLLELGFDGTLYDYQKAAIEKLQAGDNGVLVAPTGTGKTIIGLYLMTIRSRPTLILVHRSILIEQWITALCRFVPEIEKKDIGVLGAGRKKLKGKVDIAMLQSMAHMDELEAKTAGYDFLIVDECHRVPTATFEPVLKGIKARYVLGLTATPQRKDRFESIIFMQCGPVIHTIDDVNMQSQDRKVRFRGTSLPDFDTGLPVQRLWEHLTESIDRNELILSDVFGLLEEGRCPLIISDRTEHLDTLIQSFIGGGQRSEVSVFVLKGLMGKKDRHCVIESVKRHVSAHRPFCLFATGSLIGEGFDLPGLDTLVITMPISFKGRLTQYVGRLHRQNTPKKKEIVVYDYIDTCSGITISMYKKRLAAYRKLGYELLFDPEDRIAKWM